LSIEDIHVAVAGGQGFLTGNAAAVLREIAGLLEQLTQSGEGGCIDLASLPFSSADRTWLQEQLGKGEVEVSISAGGPTTIVETGTPGVWWITHRNEQNAKSGEFIEVTLVPELITTHPDDVLLGLASLNSKIMV
jgi:hydrogenase-1 operon protein HyaF